MSYQRRSTCRDCNASGNDTHISRAGYCTACSEQRLVAHNASQVAKQGDGYQRWLQGLIASEIAKLPQLPDA